MLAKVQKWGNSLAVRIPRAFASEVQLENDSLVEITLVDGQILVTPVLTVGWTLEGLLEKITPANLHGEMGTGVTVGSKTW